MLALVPATFAELEDPEQAFIAYADIAAQLETVGVTPPARGVVVLMGSPDAADIAAPIIEERLAAGASAVTGQPYAEFCPRHTVEAVPQASVVLIDLTLGEGTSRAILMQMLSSRDLGFLAW